MQAIHIIIFFPPPLTSFPRLPFFFFLGTVGTHLPCCVQLARLAKRSCMLTLSGLTNGQFPHSPVHTWACSVPRSQPIFQMPHLFVFTPRPDPSQDALSCERLFIFQWGGLSSWSCSVFLIGLSIIKAWAILWEASQGAVFLLIHSHLFHLPSNRKEASGLLFKTLLGWNRIQWKCLNTDLSCLD